jgi:hypothetical protein
MRVLQWIGVSRVFGNMSEMIPQTEAARRIAALFHRKATTPWSGKELAAYKELERKGAFKDIQDIVLLELYYGAERKKKEGGIQRRDLGTFLNNFFGELDRATAYSEGQHRTKRVRIDRERKRERPASDSEWQRLGALAKAELARFKRSMQNG